MTTPAPATATEEVLFDGRPAVVPGVGVLLVCVLTLGLLLPFFWIATKKRHYRITTQRVVVETGILGKKLEQVDLYRVTDFVVERPISERLLGTGRLVLQTMDATTPELVIRGIRADLVALYERLRAAAEAEKLRRGVRVVDYE